MDATERGAARVRALGEVSPKSAGPELARVFDDVRRTLRVPFVDGLFCVLARRPRDLVALWNAIRPGVGTCAFEEACDGLRDAAMFAEARALAGTGQWSDWPGGTHARHFTEATQYVLPKLFVITAAWRLGRVMPGSALSSSPSLPPGAPPEAEPITLVDPRSAPPKVRALLSRIQERHGHPAVATFYRGLARWPSLLASAWERIGPFVATPAYRARREVLVTGAEHLARDLFEEGARPHDPELDDVLAFFLRRLIPDVLLDVTIVRAWLDGAESARIAPMSAST